MLILIVAAVLLAVWLFLCMPSPACRRARAYRGTAFAHRGLHDVATAENSLNAFEKACAAGVGIELDVQFTKDRQLIVFHDNDLLRMTGKNAAVSELTLDEIRALHLVTDGSAIPTLAEVLETVNGLVPLLVEIKSCRDIKQLTVATAEALRNYNGAYVVESFNPLCLMHLRRLFPEIIRGQLVTTRDDYKDQSGVLAFLLSQLMLCVLARPDFVAYNQNGPISAGLWLHKYIFRTPLAAWTVADNAKYTASLSRGEMPIFENIDL